ncbi:MAG: hypothetical protein ABH952_08810 [Candidatus Omnitrophota bacterium]
MIYFINFLIYAITYCYLLTALIVFFHPITRIVSIIIIFLSALLAVKSAVLSCFSIFKSSPQLKAVPQVWQYLLLFLLSAWTYVVICRPTIDTDANIYHLPLALLMNYSVWYPGIGKLSLVFSYPNGTSVLASVFTSFEVIGFENIPGYLTWLLMGGGIFVYLTEKKIRFLNVLLVTLLFLLTPVLFWQSYNMGTDLPCSCFMLFGLLALCDKKYEDAALFFALSSLFKILGIIAYLFMVGYLFIMHFSRRERINWQGLKIILSFVLFIVYLVRMYVATGNPIYPALPLKLAPWGINIEVQRGIFNTIRVYARVERSLLGFLIFLKDFLFFPQRVHGEFWFWPFSAACLISCIFLTIKNKLFSKINSNLLATMFLVLITFAIWFIGSPLFRFLAGILMFLTLKSFVLSHEFNLPHHYLGAIYVSLYVTLLLFVINAGQHIKNDVIPLVLASPEHIRQLTFYSKDLVYTVKTKDGFEYSKATARYCGRNIPPCIHAYAGDSEERLIQDYKKYNQRFLTIRR